MSLYPSFIQTVTVGSGVAPDHALARSWAVPPIGNCTLPRRFLFGCLNYNLNVPQVLTQNEPSEQTCGTVNIYNVYNVPYLVLR